MYNTRYLPENYEQCKLEKTPEGGGGHMSKFSQGCSSYFIGFEIWPNPIFLGWQNF